MADETTNSEELLTDTEVCKLLRITPETLRKHMKDGPPTARYKDAGDLRTIKICTIGGSRRWVNASVDEFIHGSK